MITKRFNLIIIFSFILGIIFGWLMPDIMTNLNFIGTIYINLLKLLIVPILFFSITTALSSNTIENLSKITVKTILLFILMFCSSFIITYFIVLILKPGVNFSFTPIEWTGEITSITFSDFMLALFPTNIIAAASNNQILPVIIFAFAVGIAYTKVKDACIFKGQKYSNMFFIMGNKIFNMLLSWVMYLTPIGVFILIGNTVANYGLYIIGVAFKYIGTAWLACIIVAILVMLLPVWAYCKVSPIDYIKKISKVWLLTLSTCSSAATLPTTIKVCNEDFGVPSKITDIVVPLGCTIHMCGGAVSFALLAIFNIQMFNIPITFGLFILMLVVALLINMGAPGIPGGGIVIGATYLSILGIPLDFIGFYAGIYRLLDMAYTTMNVTGDVSANLLINKSEEAEK